MVTCSLAACAQMEKGGQHLLKGGQPAPRARPFYAGLGDAGGRTRGCQCRRELSWEKAVLGLTVGLGETGSDLAGRVAGKGGNAERQCFLSSLSGWVFPPARSEGNFCCSEAESGSVKQDLNRSACGLDSGGLLARLHPPALVTSGCRSLWAGGAGQYISVMDTDHIFNIEIHFRRKMIPRNRNSSAKQCAHN